LSFVTPTKDFYPFQPSYEHSYFEEVFNTTKSLMGIKDWPCELVRFEEDLTNSILATGLEGSWETSGAVGTFEITEEGVVIQYEPEQAKDPVALIATMAHELSHYILATAETDPPGGWEDHELHTDVAAVYSGFGVFLCNSAFTFQQWQDGTMSGWSSSRQGYLPESELALDLAIFCKLSDIEHKPILKMLKATPKSYFKMAINLLEDYEEDLQSLREIKC